jgi:hypothetical protein
MTDYTLYPIHSLNGIVQHAGHIILWEATAAEAMSLASSMVGQAHIVGVEIERSNCFGAERTTIVTIGLTLAEAEAQA